MGDLIKSAAEAESLSAQQLRDNRCVPSDASLTLQIEAMLLASDVENAPELADWMSKNCWGMRREGDTIYRIAAPNQQGSFVVLFSGDASRILKVVKYDDEWTFIKWLKGKIRKHQNDEPDETPHHTMAGKSA